MGESGSEPEYDESSDKDDEGASDKSGETTFKEKSVAPQPFCWAQGHTLEEPYDLTIPLYSEMFSGFF